MVTLFLLAVRYIPSRSPLPRQILGHSEKSVSYTHLDVYKRQEPYRSTVLFPFFFNMLSEGENRKLQSQLLHIDAEDDFGILLATARYDTIGAVTTNPVLP